LDHWRREKEKERKENRSITMATQTETTTTTTSIPSPAALRASLNRDGFVVIRQILTSTELTTLHAAATEATDLARAGRWPHIRTVGKQFPPWPTTPGPEGIWGVQVSTLSVIRSPATTPIWPQDIEHAILCFSSTPSPHLTLWNNILRILLLRLLLLYRTY
jgi:hypothetical protein